MIESIEEFFGDDKPKLKTKSVVEIPARSLVVVHTRVNIAPEHCERLFEATATEEMLIEHPQLVTIPLVHRTAQKNYNTVPHVLINLGKEMEIIPKGFGIAELIPMTCGINQITTETAYQVNEITLDMKPVYKHEILKGKEKDENFRGRNRK